MLLASYLTGVGRTLKISIDRWQIPGFTIIQTSQHIWSNEDHEEAERRIKGPGAKSPERAPQSCQASTPHRCRVRHANLRREERQDHRAQTEGPLTGAFSLRFQGTCGKLTASNHGLKSAPPRLTLMPARVLTLTLTGVFALVCLSSRSSTPVTVNAGPEAFLTGAGAPESGDEDFARHVETLKKKLPSSDFSILIQAPFVVVGDEPADSLKQHAEHTVKWAVDKLKQDYFSKDPKDILDIWLFKDAASYEKNALGLFGEKPSTPYGYYSSAHKALIMNISTGGGTLVHEIVHPFVEANFPACPAWLNEGLGSLYEQCGEVEGHIHGYTNWRLPGLQNAINAGTVPAFRKLMSMSARAFYDDARGTHYAASRYLCYYLQQRGLLVKFYREFHARQKEDPTGYKTLKRILNARDMNAFQQRWEQYVLTLKQGE